MRHGRKSSAKTFNGFTEHFAVDLDSTVTREVVVRPANEPEHEAVELLAEDVGESSRPVAARHRPGVHGQPTDCPRGGAGCGHHRPSLAASGSAFHQAGVSLGFRSDAGDLSERTNRPHGPRPACPVPAAACDAGALRAQCTKATRGQGRRLNIREDEPFQQKLRTKMKTQRGRASLRKRTAVEHTIAHQLAHQGRRARYKGLRKNQFDGRRHAAVSNLQVAHIMRRNVDSPLEVAKHYPN